MDELWKHVRGEPDHADLKRSWECKGVLKAVNQFLEATFNQTVEQCALCKEVGLKVVAHRLGGYGQPLTLVCDRCIDSSSSNTRRVLVDGEEINKLSAKNDMDPFSVPSQYLIDGATQETITAEYRALPDLSLIAEKMISLAHPAMNIYRVKFIGSYSFRGNCISIQQDLKAFAQPFPIIPGTQV